jgi:hypothetical protein
MLRNEEMRHLVEETVAKAPIIDMHTHLYPSNFGPLCLWGIDEVVTYHYLIAELFRSNDSISPDQFWKLSKQQQADVIWDTLFVRNTPISEATRGVVFVMTQLGLDPHAKTLSEARKFFASQDPEQHIRNVMRGAGVTDIVMTNDAFNPMEADAWQRAKPNNPHLHAALRMDPLLNSGKNPFGSISDARKFVDEWIRRMNPVYMAVSLPYDFVYPDDTARTQLIREVVIPTGRDHQLPFSMMIGVARQVNPRLKDAGDSVGHADIRSVEHVAAEFPDNRFLVSMLSRENQHELCVAARKFSNLMPFGCWWFLNNPSIVTEITSERFELLGSSFIPQHSDARILEQILYKWAHSRRVIAKVLYEQYEVLSGDGWNVTEDQIERDVRRLFCGNFEQWVGRTMSDA